MSKRFTNFDNLRGLAILAVVLIHITAPTASAEYTGAILLNQLARFGVPVFVFLSGWGLTIAKSYEKAASYVDFLQKRLSKLLPAYLLWNGIYLLYAYFFQGEMMGLGEAFKGLLYGTNYPHLYFVPLIVLFYLGFPFLRKLGKSHWGMLLSFIVTIVSLIATWGLTVEGLTRNHNPFNWLFYFVFGIWVANYNDQIKNKLSLIWVSILLVASQAIVVLEPIEIVEETLLTQTRPSVLFYSVMVILFFVLSSNWSDGLENTLNILSDYSYHIYLSHYLFIRIYREIIPSPPSSVLLLLVLISSIGLMKLKEKIVEERT